MYGTAEPWASGPSGPLELQVPSSRFQPETEIAAAYDAFLQSDAYTRSFPLPPHTVGVLTVTTGGPKRLANLKAVAEQVSHSQHFLFSMLKEIVSADPVSDPVWQICHRRGQHPLIRSGRN